MVRRITQTRLSELFQEFKPVARRYARYYSALYRKPIHEVEDEALSILGKNLATLHIYHDPKRGTPKQCLRHRLRWNVFDYCARQPDRPGSLDAVRCAGWDPPAKTDFLRNFVLGLSREARELVETICNCPAEMAEDLLKRPRTKGIASVRRVLRSQGWSLDRLNRAWREVELCLT